MADREFRLSKFINGELVVEDKLTSGQAASFIQIAQQMIDRLRREFNLLEEVEFSVGYKVVFEFLVQIPTGHFLVRRRATLPFVPFIKMSYFPDNPKADRSFIVNCVEWVEEKNEFYVGIENCIISIGDDSVDEYIKWWRSAGWTVNDDHVTRER